MEGNTVQAFFCTHSYLNISAVAKIAGLNPGLVRQYASGIKSPSEDQAKKIEKAIHLIGAELEKVSFL